MVDVKTHVLGEETDATIAHCEMSSTGMHAVERAEVGVCRMNVVGEVDRIADCLVVDHQPAAGNPIEVVSPGPGLNTTPDGFLGIRPAEASRMFSQEKRVNRPIDDVAHADSAVRINDTRCGPVTGSFRSGYIVSPFGTGVTPIMESSMLREKCVIAAILIEPIGVSQR